MTNTKCAVSHTGRGQNAYKHQDNPFGDGLNAEDNRIQRDQRSSKEHQRCHHTMVPMTPEAGVYLGD
jgi:hypothetical protein